MNRNETIDLLTAIAAFDQRTVGQADVAAWHAVVGDLDARDAAQAVIEHHKHSTDRIKPAHVISIVRGIRNDRANRENVKQCRELDPAGVASEDTRKRVTDMVRDLWGPPTPQEKAARILAEWRATTTKESA